MTKPLIGVTTFTALALIAAVSASAAEGSRQSVCQRVPYVSFVLSDQRIVTVPVTVEQIRESPPWDAQSGKEPPLSVGDALRLASAEFARTVPNPERWTLYRINVEALCDKRAVYLAWWSEQGKSGGQLAVPVLMSGVALSTSSAVAAAKKAEP